MELDRTFTIFTDPPRQFGLIPFWFWNDDLDEEELLRQLRTFHDAGFGGVLPHARIGLSRRVGYLTGEYFRLIRLVVGEAARLDMKIILYDEASYPSGSARGGVVAENPDYASQAIGLWEKDVEGPHSGFWRPNTGRALLDRHVCTVLGRVDEAGCIDPDSLKILEPQPHTLFHIEIPQGRWKVMSVWNTHSGGHIRGAFPEEESGHATAPAAGDILNPEAVSCFLRLTHDQYYAHLEEFFGDPIIALFTDEPGFSKQAISLAVKWSVRDVAGTPLDLPVPGDWSRCPGWELFSGTLVYATEIEVPAADAAVLDLGQVGDIAEVRVDGEPAGRRLWAPYRIDLGDGISPGPHQLEIRVTNTMANAYEGLQAPSGLLGPVRLITRTSI